MDWFEIVRERVVPVADGVQVTAYGVWIALGVALVAVLIDPVWRVLRLAVTLVHELGHALVGMAVGRRFTGFVLRGDMSGHAVTVGRPRGPGRVVSTWAGYPAPAVVGAAMAWVPGRGWAAAFIAGVIVILLVAVVRVRSALTLVVMVVALAATGALWWWRDDVLQAQLLVGAGVVLGIGAWRHLGAVAATSDRSSDPGVLASLTHVPRVVWNLSFVVVGAASSWLVATEVLTALR
jgi:hypothetical protein